MHIWMDQSMRAATVSLCCIGFGYWSIADHLALRCAKNWWPVLSCRICLPDPLDAGRSHPPLGNHNWSPNLPSKYQLLSQKDQSQSTVETRLLWKDHISWFFPPAWERNGCRWDWTVSAWVAPPISWPYQPCWWIWSPDWRLKHQGVTPICQICGLQAVAHNIALVQWGPVFPHLLPLSLDWPCISRNPSSSARSEWPRALKSAYSLESG